MRNTKKYKRKSEKRRRVLEISGRTILQEQKEKEMKVFEEALRHGIDSPKKVKKIVNKFDKMEIVRVD